MVKKITFAAVSVLCTYYSVISFWSGIGDPNPPIFEFVTTIVAIILAPVFIILSAYTITKKIKADTVALASAVSFAIVPIIYLIMTSSGEKSSIADSVAVATMIFFEVHAAVLFVIGFMKTVKSRKNT